MAYDVLDAAGQERGERTEESHRIRLSGMDAPAAARRFVRGLMAGLDEDLLQTAVLLTSEIVTNALLHAGTAMELSVSRTGEQIRVMVADGKDSLPRIPRKPLTREELLDTRRGMALIVALADDFGWRPLPDRSGKVVWFTLRSRRQADDQAT